MPSKTPEKSPEEYPAKKDADVATHLPCWFVYILRCSDQSLYTGITTNMERRLKEHNSSVRGASYTRGRRPVTLAYCHQCACRSTASQDEARIKRLPRAAKEQLIANYDL